MTINDNNPVDPVPYEGVYAAFEGFEGENQNLLDSLVQNLPEVYKETLLEKISFINVCISLVVLTSSVLFGLYSF